MVKSGQIQPKLPLPGKTDPVKTPTKLSSSLEFNHQQNGSAASHKSTLMTGSVRKPSVPDEMEKPTGSVHQSIQRFQDQFGAEGLRNRNQNGLSNQQRVSSNHFLSSNTFSTADKNPKSSKLETPPLPTAKVQPVRKTTNDGTMTVGRPFTNMAGSRQPIPVNSPMVPESIILEGLRKNRSNQVRF